eukprot:3690136-Pleurochrysis_carterae.AAC.1
MTMKASGAGQQQGKRDELNGRHSARLAAPSNSKSAQTCKGRAGRVNAPTKIVPTIESRSKAGPLAFPLTHTRARPHTYAVSVLPPAPPPLKKNHLRTLALCSCAAPPASRPRYLRRPRTSSHCGASNLRRDLTNSAPRHHSSSCAPAQRSTLKPAAQQTRGRQE